MTDFVGNAVRLHILGAIGVQIVGKHNTAFLGRRNGERAHTSKHISYHVGCIEEFDESLMFRVKP